MGIVDFGPDIEVVILDVSEVKIEVEIVALELKSIEPIQVRVANVTDAFFVPGLFEIIPGIPWLEYFEPEIGETRQS